MTSDPARLPAQLAKRWRKMNWNSVRWEKKYFLLGRLNQPSQDRKLLYMHDKLNEPPFICTLWVPHLPQFQPSAGATTLLYSLSASSYFSSWWFLMVHTAISPISEKNPSAYSKNTESKWASIMSKIATDDFGRELFDAQIFSCLLRCIFSLVVVDCKFKNIASSNYDSYVHCTLSV